MEVTSFTNSNKLINFISIKLIFSLITRCKKFILILIEAFIPCVLKNRENLFNWHLLISYFIIFTIKRGEYIVNVTITICYYHLPFAICHLTANQESLSKFVKSRIFVLGGLILSFC